MPATRRRDWSKRSRGPAACRARVVRRRTLSRNQNNKTYMDKVTRYEWHGSGLILVLFCLLGITIPFAVVYFVTNLLSIETQVADGTKLSEFLDARK